VHGFTSGVYVTAATAGLLVLLALAGLLTEWRRTGDEDGAVNAIGVESLERAA